MPATTGLPALTLWAAFDAWLRRAREVVAASTEALNAMNVFPVADADTGSNLTLTLSGIARAVPDGTGAGPWSQPLQLDDLVQAAILSAHGSSGAIVAEMFTSVCRTLEQQHDELADLPTGRFLAHLLRTVARAARAAVAQPVAGTILTVADRAAAAADEAARSQPDDALAVARAARDAARTALAETPSQLDVLAAAGVPDAGGQAFSLLVDALVEVLGGEPAVPLVPGDVPAAAAPGTPSGPTEYEVMYALHAADPEGLVALRNRLSVLGRSVVVVGDQSMAQVHVHLADAGAAVEAGLAVGLPSQIRISALAAAASPAERTVVAVVAGPGLAEAVRSLGGVAVVPDGVRPPAALLEEALDRTCGEVVVLPNDMESLEVAALLAQSRRAAGRRIAVIPTVAQVQGLAAMAVHEPSADFDSVVVAMSSAAAHARHGAVTVAETPAMTMAGRCEPGDVLGVVEGDFVEIGDSPADVGWRVLRRLLSGGGELVTLVRGAGSGPELADALRTRVQRELGGVDVEVLDGGPARYPLLIGVE